MTEKEKILKVLEFFNDECYTSDIVDIFNEWCEDNNYPEICYPIDLLDDRLSNYSPSKILRMAEQCNFKSNNPYFWITDCDDLYSFEFYDDEDSPIDAEELAKEIVRNDNAYGNKSLREFLDSLEEQEE